VPLRQFHSEGGDYHHEAHALPNLGGTHRESLAAVAFPESLLMTVASPFSGRTARTSAYGARAACDPGKAQS
jgi:hypothetical protein